MALSREEFKKTLTRALLGGAENIQADIQADIQQISTLMNTQNVPSADTLQQRLDKKVKDDHKLIYSDPSELYLRSGDSPSPRGLLMASLVPHVLDALIENSEDGQKRKYKELKEQEDVIQTAVLYSTAELMKGDGELEDVSLLDDNEQNPLAETLRICQKLHDEGYKASKINPQAIPNSQINVSKLMDGEQSLDLVNYSKTYHLKSKDFSSYEFNKHLEVIQNAESELASKKFDKKIIKEQGFNTETLAAALKEKGSSSKREARVAANVRYVIKALEKKDSNASDLNVGQIQLVAMFLDGISNKSIEAFKKFAEANKQKYGFDDDGISKLANAMRECHNAFTKGPEELEGNPLAQVLYVSFRIDSHGNNEKFVDMVKRKIEIVVGKEQGSLLINRSKMVIKKTLDPDFKYQNNSELCEKITRAHQEASNQESAEVNDLKKASNQELADAYDLKTHQKASNQELAEVNDLKKAMEDALEEFKKNKKVGTKKTLKESDQKRLEGMDKILQNLPTTDRDELDEVRDKFRKHAAQHTGWGWSKQTATSKKFEQSLKTKSQSRQ